MDLPFQPPMGLKSGREFAKTGRDRGGSLLAAPYPQNATLRGDGSHGGEFDVDDAMIAKYCEHIRCFLSRIRGEATTRHRAKKYGNAKTHTGSREKKRPKRCEIHTGRSMNYEP